MLDITFPEVTLEGLALVKVRLGLEFELRFGIRMITIQRMHLQIAGLVNPSVKWQHSSP